jgi:hypothetical protein
MDTNTAPKLIVQNSSTVNEFSYSVVLKKDISSEIGVGISTLLNTISLKQSLLRYSISLELSLVDGVNLVDDGFLSLGSVVQVTLFKFDDDLPENKITLNFYITNIENSIQTTSQKEKVYDIVAYTFPAVTNAWPLIQFYPEDTPSNVIKEIVKSRFVVDANKEIGTGDNWIESKNTIKNGFIFHQIKPFDAISRLLSQSLSSQSDDSAYFFYQDYQGFKLRTARSIASDANKQRSWKYTFYPERNDPAAGNSVEKDYFRVLYLSQYEHSNYFDLIASGVLRSEIMLIDLINREVKTPTKTFKYEDDNKNIFLLGNNSAIDTSYPIFAKNKELNPLNLKYDFTPASYIAVSENAWERDDYLEEKYLYARAQRSLLEQTKITIEVYGNPSIKPGDILNLNVPAKSGIIEDEDSNRQSGDFIVGAVKHNIAGSIFQTYVDLYKDAYEKTFV